VRALPGPRRDDLLHGADRDPRVHEVGEDHPWYRDVIGGGRCPIVDNWWQTETGAIMISPVPGVTTTKPGLGYPSPPGVEARIVSEDDEDAGTAQGLLTLRRPWPSTLRTLYRDDERFVNTYFTRFGSDCTSWATPPGETRTATSG
jgi:acyl-coenzyme A synthetase/AMP-(fatty) acid ligase